MRALVAVLLVLLIAGCARVPDPPGDLGIVRDVASCHAAPAVASQNAPLAEGFLGPPEEVLARLAAHVGANATTGLTEVEPNRWTQWTDDGELRLERVGGVDIYGPITYAGWTGNRTWSPSEEEARAWIDRLLRAFAADPSTVHVGALDPTQGAISFRQQLAGQQLGEAGGELYLSRDPGSRPSLGMHALHSLPPASFAVTEEGARAIAIPHARCLLDASGRTEAAGYTMTSAESGLFRLHGDSVARAVHVLYTEPGDPSHCGMSVLVHVDAMSGDVLGAGRPPCD